MSESFEINVPRDIVNDDFVTIVEWKVRSGERVRIGDTIALVETAKSILEIEAETAGVIEVLQGEGSEVEVGATLARISSSDPIGQSATTKTVADTVGSGSVDTEVFFSAKAQALLYEHGIAADVFSGRGLVREADVLAHIRQEERTAVPSQEPEVAPAVETDAVELSIDLGSQSLWADARASAGERGKGMVWLACNYIWRNWFLGNAVRWAPRFATLAIHRARGVEIGKGCFIDPNAIIETAFPENISLGDDVRIAASVVIMTHIKPPHYLRQTGIVESVVKPVRIEDHAFVGVNAVLAPGVIVGKASVVANGAVVVNNVPPLTMVAGNPASIVRRFN